MGSAARVDDVRESSMVTEGTVSSSPRRWLARRTLAIPAA